MHIVDLHYFSPAMIGVTVFTMKRNGPDYVDQPKYIIFKAPIFTYSLYPLGWFTWQGHRGALPDLEILLVLRSNLAAPIFADICDEGQHQFLL